MKQTTDVQTFTTDKAAREHLKSQLIQYLGQQPESTQSLHRWMKGLEAAGVGIIIAAFVVALYVSIAWKSVNPIVIPIAWFVFAASAAAFWGYLAYAAGTLNFALITPLVTILGVAIAIVIIAQLIYTTYKTSASACCSWASPSFATSDCLDASFRAASLPPGTMAIKSNFTTCRASRNYFPRFSEGERNDCNFQCSTSGESRRADGFALRTGDYPVRV